MCAVMRWGSEYEIIQISVYSRQYLEFLEDLEDDDIIRKNVNIYRGKIDIKITACSDMEVNSIDVVVGEKLFFDTSNCG